MKEKPTEKECDCYKGTPSVIICPRDTDRILRELKFPGWE